MPNEPNVLPPDAAKSSVRDREQAIAALAARQKGVIDREQLRALGLSRHEIQRRIGRTLHRLFNGVYAVGHGRVSREGRYMAAVLAVGEGAVISHFAAADLHDLRASRGGDIDVSAPNKRRKQRGLRPHQTPVAPNERTTRQGIPVTTATRTIHDLAEHLNEAQLEDLIRKAEYTSATTLASLSESLNRHPNQRGNETLRAAIENAQEGKGITRSQLEKCFRAFVRKHKLPAPQYNAPIHLPERTYEVDCLWPAAKLIVELDGRDAHTTSAAFEEDRARDAALTAAGYRVIRATKRRIRTDPDALDAQLRMLVADDRAKS